MHVSDQGGLLRARGGCEERVTPLELFFDLVFVFALTQVTGFLVDHLTWLGMLQDAALLTVLWSSWASVALYLLGHNAFRLRDEGIVSVPRVVVTILCCVLILVAVSVPSLITLAVLTVVLCGLAGYEMATSREFRCELRAR